jgi:hypothetical protein
MLNTLMDALQNKLCLTLQWMSISLCFISLSSCMILTNSALDFFIFIVKKVRHDYILVVFYLFINTQKPINHYFVNLALLWLLLTATLSDHAAKLISLKFKA